MVTALCVSGGQISRSVRHDEAGGTESELLIVSDKSAPASFAGQSLGLSSSSNPEQFMDALPQKLTEAAGIQNHVILRDVMHENGILTISEFSRVEVKILGVGY